MEEIKAVAMAFGGFRNSSKHAKISIKRATLLQETCSLKSSKINENGSSYLPLLLPCGPLTYRV